MKIKVAGQYYQVMVVDQFLETTQSRGQCCSDTLIIRISAKLPLSRFLETLIHEVGHAIYHEYAIDEVKGEEAINSLYMSGFHQVLIDNPEYRDIISSDDAAKTWYDKQPG